MQGILNLVPLILIALVFYFRPELKALKWVQYWALIKVNLGWLYLLIFIHWGGYLNWYIHFAITMVGAILFTFAVRELCWHFFKKKVKWIYLTTPLILLTPFLSFVPFMTRFYLIYAIANFFVIFEAPRAFREKNLYIISLSMTSFLSVAIDVLQFMLPARQADLVFDYFGFASGMICYLTFIGAALWFPVSQWLYQKLSFVFGNSYLKPALVEGRGFFAGSEFQVQRSVRAEAPVVVTEAQVLQFPGSFGNAAESTEIDYLDSINDDLDAMEPVFETAAKMIAISRKPFLNLSEVALYLDVSEKEAEEFVEKYSLKRVYLTDDSEEYVIRRIDIDYLREDEKEH